MGIEEEEMVGSKYGRGNSLERDGRCDTHYIMSPRPLSWGNDFACNFGVGLLCGKDHKGERGV